MIKMDGPGGLKKMYEAYALKSVRSSAERKEESWWDKRQKRMKELLREQVELAQARNKAERECWLMSSKASSVRLHQFLTQEEGYEPDAKEPDTNVVVETYENLMSLFSREIGERH